MVAALRDEQPAPLPLILEPKARAFRPWLRDDWGAAAQHIVIGRFLYGMSRIELARRFAYSERQIGAIVQGRAWAPYTTEIRKILRRYGFGGLRGEVSATRRLAPQLTGQRALIARLADLLADDPRPAAREAVREARVLTAEPGRLS